MTQQKITELGYILVGGITSTGIGAFVLQALGAFVLGLMGALAGYIFARFIKPELDKLFKKKK